MELADAYLKVGDVQGKPYTPNLGDSAGAVRSYSQAATIAEPFARSETGARATARRILSRACESLGGVQSRLNHWEEATRNHRRALALREELLRTDPAHAEEWRSGIVADYSGLGDALINAHRFQPDTAAQHEALENYRRALPLCEAMAAAHPEDEKNAFWLSKICSRIATVQTDIGAAEKDPAAYREAGMFHQRAVALEEAMVKANPSNPIPRRNLADELIAFA